MISKYLIGALLIVSLLGGTAFKFLLIEKENHAVTKIALVQNEKVIASYKQALSDMTKHQETFTKTNSALFAKYSEAKRDLDGFRGRESTILAKKSLISLRINKAYMKQERAFACVTGDTALCVD